MRLQGSRCRTSNRLLTSRVLTSLLALIFPVLGDKAMWTPKSGLYVLRGDTLIKINPGLFPDFNTKTIAVARAVLPKI